MAEDDAKPIAKGILGRAFARLFLKRCQVGAHAIVAPRFHMIELEGAALRDARWKPGDVIQIGMTAFSARTFTPVDWDASAGSTRFLRYEHGAGPGSEWLASAACGRACDFFGPRAAMDLDRAKGTKLIFGDETSFGLALAASRFTVGPTRNLFEVSCLADSQQAVAAIGLEQADLVVRDDEDAHIGELLERLEIMVRDCDTFILSGKAQSIQRVRQSLRRLAIPSSRIVVKAHWAPGKAGLD